VPTALSENATGHETDSMFQRYAIVDGYMMKAAAKDYAAKLQEIEDQPHTLRAVR
jgi:hypothetical protein